MYSFITLFAVLMPILKIILIILAIYTMIILIKALKIYIRNNSWFTNRNIEQNETTNYQNSVGSFLWTKLNFVV